VTTHYSLAVLGRCIGRSTRAVFYAAKAGHLGKPKIVGRRRLWSLKAAEAHYGVKVSPERLSRACNKPGAAVVVELVDRVRQLRDDSWLRHLAKHGITVTPPEASL